MKNRFLSYLVLLALLLPFQSQGQALMDRVNEYIPIQLSPKLRFLPAPSLSYKPETNFALGISLQGFYNEHPTETNLLSSFQLDIIYTLNKQFIIDGDYSIKKDQGNWLFQGSNSFYQYPQKFYGLDGEQDPEDISYSKVELYNQAYRMVAPQLYVGLMYHYLRLTKFTYPSGGDFDRLLLEIGLPEPYHGVGLGSIYDQRKNLANPKAGGSYLSFFSEFYPRRHRHSGPFIQASFDLRHYIGLFSEKHILALQSIGVFTSQDPGWWLSARLGGSQIMRGYYKGQYFGKNLLAAQMEYRFPIYQRFAGVVFGGLGQVDNDWKKLFGKELKPSYGLGFRFLLDKDNNANLRLDLGFGKNSSGVYLSYGEAF